MTLRQYYRAALFFPLIPPVISGIVTFLTYPLTRRGVDIAGSVLYVSAVGLIPYLPCALLFAFWEFRRPVPPRYYTLVLLAFPPACFLLVLIAAIVISIATRDQPFGDSMRGTLFLGTVIVAVGYLYVAIIAGIAAI